MTLDFSQSPLPPFKHQREDTEWLLTRPYAFVTNEMRTGKSKTVIDAAQFLFQDNKIDRVIVIAPAPVRDVWYDEILGEIAKHAWKSLRHIVMEFHSQTRYWHHVPPVAKDTPLPRGLTWLVSNYEFIIVERRLKELLDLCDARTLLILDESALVKSWSSQRTKACYKLRKKCGRVFLLNGTPIFDSPLDLFAQGNLLHEDVIGTKFITQFRARYGIQEPIKGAGGRVLTNPKTNQPLMKVVKWTNLDDLQRRFAHCTIRRLQSECPDMPVKLPPVLLTATLTPKTWQYYKSMRDELVAFLTTNTAATSATAAIKAMRLSQITSGFLGGIEEIVADDLFSDAELPDDEQAGALPSAIEVGREKLDVLLWFIEQQLESDPNFKLVTWSRFRPEVFRAEQEVRKRFPQFETAVIVGGQKRAERLRALSLLKPETAPAGPVFVSGIEGTGSFGLDMCAAHTCVTVSSGYSPGRSAQTLDRVYGPGQKHPISYYEIIAVGPKGQKTIDKDVLVARRDKQDIATWVSSDWVRHLTEE